MYRFGFSLLSLFLLGLLTSGCEAIHPTNISFYADGRGPLTSIKPITVSIQVEDQRPPEEQDSVVLRRTAIGGADTWCTKKTAPLIVQDAVISELRVCGLRATPDTSTPIDARVRIALKRFRDLEDSRFSEKALVEAEVVVTNEATHTTTPPFQVSGNYQHAVGSMYRGPDKAMTKALAEFIHNLTFDSRLVEGLQ